MKSTAGFGSAPWDGAATGNWWPNRLRNQQVRVTGGYNDFDFRLLVETGGETGNACIYGGFSSEGFGRSPGCCTDSSGNN